MSLPPLAEAAVAVLTTADGRAKTALSRRYAAAWQAACEELGRDVDPGARRANVLVEGLTLADTFGERLRLGGCVVEIVHETVPCRLMDDAAPGLQAALRPERRAGVYGRIVEGGELRVGDPVSRVDSE